jgi:hypothetical protein
MTLLEAVNILLSVIGEAPVESLATTNQNEITDSALARRALEEVERDVQSEGWSWNTEFCYPLTKTGEGKFTIPLSALRVEFSAVDYPDGRYVIRGLQVWDRIDHTALFPDVEELHASLLVRRLSWDEIPHPAQQYMVIRAARIYASRFVNSNVIYGYTINDEQYARAMLMRDEENKEVNNMLWGNSLGNPQGLGFLPSRGRRYRIN